MTLASSRRARTPDTAGPLRKTHLHHCWQTFQVDCVGGVAGGLLPAPPAPPPPPRPPPPRPPAAAPAPRRRRPGRGPGEEGPAGGGGGGGRPRGGHENPRQKPR